MFYAGLLTLTLYHHLSTFDFSKSTKFDNFSFEKFQNCFLSLGFLKDLTEGGFLCHNINHNTKIS